MFVRLVRRPGLKQGHSSHCKMEKGRLARVYSKALVEMNSEEMLKAR
jgi:hypothetical protein